MPFMWLIPARACQSMLEHVRACQSTLEHVRAGFTCQGMVNMLRSQFQKLCLNSDKYGVNSRKYRLAMLTVFSMLAVFAMLAISWFIEIGIRSSLLHSCVLQMFICSRFTELQTCRFDCFEKINFAVNKYLSHRSIPGMLKHFNFTSHVKRIGMFVEHI